MKPKLIDLFSGCGGMSLGFQNAGFDILAAYDNWWPAIDIYSRNFEHPIYKRDLSDESVIEEIANKQPDIIIGGPPCQDFSIAGNRNFEGKRANLTLSFGKIIETIRPKWFVMENVYNIEKSPVFEKVLSIFKNSGYGITKRVWDASYMGVPQMRRRYFVIGKLGAEDDFMMDELLGGLSKTPTTVRDYLGTKLGTQYYYMHPRSYQRRAIFCIDEPSSTIRGVNRPMPTSYKAHPADKTTDFSKVKNLSTEERSWIQTFPEGFVFCGSKADIEQTIGNAVPVKMAEYIAKAIIKNMAMDTNSTTSNNSTVEEKTKEQTPIRQIQTALKSIRWNTFQSTIKDFLSAFVLPQPSIERVVSQVNNSSCGPLYVYRKAVLFCCNDCSVALFENQCVSYDKFPLVFTFTPDGLYWRSKEGSIGFTNYENVYQHIDCFLPLIVNDRNKKDYYKTQDFGSNVASIFRSLREDGNDEQISIRTILNLIYIALFPIKEFNSELTNILSGNFDSYNKRIETLWALYKDSGYIKETDVSINRDSFEYIKSLLSGDKNDIDIEVLTSLVYKLLDKDDATLYGHQNSFLNVQKAINPLLLDSFRKELNGANSSRLKEIANEIVNITCLDPTNSPGCFLSAAYLGLLDILESIDNKLGSSFAKGLKIENFVSIVDNEIAAELTRLTLVYCKLSGKDMLSSQDINETYNNISVNICNPLYARWEDYVHNPLKTYIIGSPRFLGSQKIKRQKILKDAVTYVYGRNVGTVDYCSAWLVKAARFIQGNESKAAFVLTNSVVQGVQVSEIWKTIYSLGCEIAFAYESFKWKTSETTNIGVTVVVIGIQGKQNNTKLLFRDNQTIECEHIGPYLLPDTEIIVEEENTNLFGILPFIRKGNMAYDGSSTGPGKLLMDSYDEVLELKDADERSSKYIKRIVGSEEYINAIRRWCLWIPFDELPQDIEEMPLILRRIENVRVFRATSTASAKCKSTPHKFRESYQTSSGMQSLVIPSVSSENRPYIPVGFINDQIVVSNLAFCVYDCDIWVMAIISSRMHMLWIKTVCGALETRYRYSNTLGYNAFPVPYISEENKVILKKLVLSLISVREKYCDLSLGELYNNMPDDLLKIHNLIDNAVDSLYKEEPFNNDSERISHLINMYQSKKKL